MVSASDTQSGGRGFEPQSDRPSVCILGGKKLDLYLPRQQRGTLTLELRTLTHAVKIMHGCERTWMTKQNSRCLEQTDTKYRWNVSVYGQAN